MRMWMVNPKIMCRKHLLGEHLETHMFFGSLNKGVLLDGYALDNMLELKSLGTRHDELVAEMESRGYNHTSPLYWGGGNAKLINNQSEDVRKSIINVSQSRELLLSRCSECKERSE